LWFTTQSTNQKPLDSAVFYPGQFDTAMLVHAVLSHFRKNEFMRTGSRFTELDLQEPIINAPMIGAAGGKLAAAVSNAGGLGLIGMQPKGNEEWFATEYPYVRNLDKPWGVGFIGWALTEDLAFYRHVLSHNPAFMSASFVPVSDRRMRDAFRMAKDSNIMTSIQVGSAAEIDSANIDDIDVLVVRGSEGGGHGRNRASTLSLLQYALTATDKPIVAAGGIGTASGVAAVLAAGAVAAWVGTRFVTATESLTSESKKDAIDRAGLDDTIYTHAFDIAFQLPWSRDFGGRALSNDFAQEWAGREDELQTLVQENPKFAESIVEAQATGDLNRIPVYAGEAAAFTSNNNQNAADIINELSEFRRLLARAASKWASA
jgi:nitronate monooxygenase